MKAVNFFILLLFFISFIPPASANAVDTSIEVVSRGIEQFLEYRAEKNLADDFGVTFGNTSDSEALTPSQKLVYMIAAADQNPYQTKWVRDQLAADFVWFVIAIFFISLITFILTLLQKHSPGFVSAIDKRFIGHDEIHDYTVWLEVLLTIVVLFMIFMPTIEWVLEFEQDISSGFTLDAMQYLKLTSSGPNVFFWESVAYGTCAPMFLIRIQYINWFAANALKIIILFAVSIWYSRYLAEMLAAWFLSCVFMRPLVLFYSNIALKNIAAAYPKTDSMYGDLAGVLDVLGVTSQSMQFVIFASAITCIVAVLGPVIIFFIKIVWDYLITAIIKIKMLLRLV